MTTEHNAGAAQLWIELPPVTGLDPKRLLVFLHSAGTSTEEFLPVAIHWQLRFPSAVSTVLHDPIDPTTGLAGWVSQFNLDDETELALACSELQRRIQSAQLAFNLGPNMTAIIAHGIGAAVALETLRRHANLATIYVGYATRLASGIKPREVIAARVHLIHGTDDTVIPIAQAQRAFKGLQAIGTKVTLDVVPEGTHWIDQEMINLGTNRMMKTLFEGRQRPNKIDSALN
jgi:phospholipase/carboxylesterase